MKNNTGGLHLNYEIHTDKMKVILLSILAKFTGFMFEFDLQR